MNVSVRKYFALLWKYVQPYWLLVLLLLCSVLLAVALTLTIPRMLGQFIDIVVAKGPLDKALRVAGLFLALTLAQQLILVINSAFAANIAWRATNKLRIAIFDHVMSLDLAFIRGRPPGDFVERVNGDVTALSRFFSTFAVSLLSNILLMVGLIIAVAFVDWRLALAFLCFGGVGLWAMKTYPRIGTSLWGIERQASAELQGFVEERLAGARDLRTSGGVDAALRTYAVLWHYHFIALRRAIITGAISFGAARLVLVFFYTCVFLVSVLLVQQNAFTIGTAVLVLRYAQLYMQPLEEITNEIEVLQQSLASIERITELLNTRATVLHGPIADLGSYPAAIAFSHVNFAYPGVDGGTLALRDCTFTIAPGEKLGLIGRTGSGKSSVAQLLMQLYSAQSGHVTVNGIDVGTIAPAALHKRIALVTQETQFFDASLRDNLRMFDESIGDKKIEEVLSVLNLLPWIRALPLGLDTLLSSQHAFSVGEGQLLALVRVALRDPDIVILDEATAHLDRITERQLRQAIDKLLQGRTGIVIAHRLETLEHVDQIVVLANGRVVEQGRRTDLVTDPDSTFFHLLQLNAWNVEVEA